MKTLTLKSGKKIPQLGFGTWKLTGQTAADAVKYALEIGYRHIDTADAYGNHFDVAKGIKESGIKREDFFLTSKVFYQNLTPKGIQETGERALKELGVEYLDLFLLHWPNRSVPIFDQLNAMRELKERGLIKAMGVSNYNVHHLKDALESGIEFDINQVEFHPTLNQKELKEFCDKHQIIVTAYSPIGRGEDLKLPAINLLAEKYRVTPSQIILAWLMAKGLVAIPKASGKEHILDNFKSLELELKPEDVGAVDALNINNRVVNPDHSDFEY